MNMYTKDALAEIVVNSRSVAEVLRKLGIHPRQHGRISELIDRFGLDRSHFQAAHKISNISEKKHWSYHLIDGKSLTSDLRRRALLESGRRYNCERCGIGPEWCGEPLVLQIDHKNGVRTDNRPDNLRFLCPNCHAQTPTFGKVKCSTAKRCSCGNKSKKGRCWECYKSKPSKAPNKELLRRLIWEYPTTKIATSYGVSDKAVAKWCKKYGLEKPPRGYWTKLSK